MGRKTHGLFQTAPDPVALYGTAEALGNSESKSIDGRCHHRRRCLLTRPGLYGEGRAGAAQSPADVEKISPAPDRDELGVPFRRACGLPALGRGGQPGAPRPRASCGPWSGDARAPGDRRQWPSARESRGDACGSACSVDRSSSRRLSVVNVIRLSWPRAARPGEHAANPVDFEGAYRKSALTSQMAAAGRERSSDNRRRKAAIGK